MKEKKQPMFQLKAELPCLAVLPNYKICKLCWLGGNFVCTSDWRIRPTCTRSGLKRDKCDLSQSLLPKFLRCKRNNLKCILLKETDLPYVSYLRERINLDLDYTPVIAFYRVNRNTNERVGEPVSIIIQESFFHISLVDGNSSNGSSLVIFLGISRWRTRGLARSSTRTTGTCFRLWKKPRPIRSEKPVLFYYELHHSLSPFFIIFITSLERWLEKYAAFRLSYRWRFTFFLDEHVEIAIKLYTRCSFSRLGNARSNNLFFVVVVVDVDVNFSRPLMACSITTKLHTLVIELNPKGISLRAGKDIACSTSLNLSFINLSRFTA